MLASYIHNTAETNATQYLSMHVAIMLQKLSIALLRSAPKNSDYIFEKMLIIPRTKPLIFASNVS